MQSPMTLYADREVLCELSLALAKNIGHIVSFVDDHKIIGKWYLMSHESNRIIYRGLFVRELGYRSDFFNLAETG